MSDETYNQILWLESLRDELADGNITVEQAIEILENAANALRKNGK